ncbi:MAG: hypothetical protein ACOCTP_02450 [Roseicyclus sp.]
MTDRNPSRIVVAELTRGLSHGDLDVLRRNAGLEHLPEGSLSAALAEHGFTVEDLVTLLMATLVEKSDQTARQAREIHRLNGLCRDQLKAMDRIADQTVRLRRVLAALDPQRPTARAMDQLKALVESPTRRRS